MRNHAGMTRVAWLAGGLAVLLSSCANLGGASRQASELAAPLLREVALPADGSFAVAVLELPLPPVEAAQANIELPLPPDDSPMEAALPPPTRVAAAEAALAAPTLGESEPSGRGRSEGPLGALEPAVPVPELSLRAGTEPASLAGTARVEAPQLPQAVPARKPAARTTTAAAAAPAASPAPAATARAATAAPATAGTQQRSAAATHAAAAAPAAAVATSPVASTAASTAANRTIYARPGDDVEVAFDGEGWVLMDVQNLASPTGASGLRFVRRDLGRNRTAFSFHAERVGDYAASFQLQHLATGAVESSRAAINVVPAAELGFYVAGASRSGGGTTVTEGEPAVARAAANRLYTMGLNKAALEEYRKIAASSGVDPEVTLRIAELNERLGNSAAALTGWLPLLAVPEYREQAVGGVIRAAAALGDGDRVTSNLDALFRVRGSAIGRELVEVARYAERTSQDALELTVLEEYLARYPQGDLADEVYYRLGGLLEKAWEGRDLKRSRECYEAVLSEHPTSSFALASGDRLDYLKRHFFYVR